MNQPLNKKQEAALGSYRATEQHIDDNIAVIAAIPAFQATYNQFKANIAAISDAVGQKSVLSGIAADKKALRESLVNLASPIAGVIYSYAVAVSDLPLRDEMDIKASTFTRARDENLAPLCQIIHDRAQTNLAALADYNITNTKLAALQTAIDNYAAAVPKPRAAASNRKTTNASLAAVFRDTDELLANQLDKQVESLRADHPAFVQTYESVRHIVKPPTRPRTTKSTADKMDDKPPK